jgi:hypothetical protein
MFICDKYQALVVSSIKTQKYLSLENRKRKWYNPERNPIFHFQERRSPFQHNATCISQFVAVPLWAVQWPARDGVPDLKSENAIMSYSRQQCHRWTWSDDGLVISKGNRWNAGRFATPSLENEQCEKRLSHVLSVSSHSASVPRDTSLRIVIYNVLHLWHFYDSKYII